MPLHTHCRICEAPLPEPFIDFGDMPLANAFLASPEECANEPRYPLAVTGCPNCGLAQLTYVVPPEQLFRHYLYVSSTSEAVRRYVAELAGRLVREYHLGRSDLVVELGSNDGLVLEALQRQGVRVLGVEPARNVAAIARSRGVHTIEEFFSEAIGTTIASDHQLASLILARHVFAHIDDLHDFFRGIARLLAPDGALLIEIPYLGDLIAQLEFDTIYHEHLSYLALKPISSLCERHGFKLVDVERVRLHGGSVLLSIQWRQAASRTSPRLDQMQREEEASRLTQPATLGAFAQRVLRWKQDFEGCIEGLIRSGACLVGYGAAAKANTLLNFCPSVASTLACILDRSPYKHGRLTPGTHLPVVDVNGWKGNGTTHLLILAWNLKEEIMAQMQSFAQQGGRFIIPIPHPEVVG